MVYLKRLLAVMLTMCIALSDCGGITVFAISDSDFKEPVETSVSENDAQEAEIISPASDESVSGDSAGITEPDSAADETSEKLALPALHMGQIRQEDTLPVAGDPSFLYDLPISFEVSDHLLLFANYSTDRNSEAETGGLVWSILRGEKGMTPGTTVLLNQEDDWTDFETVSDAPWFTLTQIDDAASEYDTMAELVKKDAALSTDIETDENGETDSNYDYYIRAAYYVESDADQEEMFSAAVTVPFLPANDTVAEQTPEEDASAAEEIPADDLSGETSVSENDTDVVYDDTAADAPDNGSVSDNNVSTDAQEPAGNDAAEADQSAQEASSLSENNAPLPAAADESRPLEKNPEGSLTLFWVIDNDTDILDEKDLDEPIPMIMGNIRQISASSATPPTITIPDDLVWESDDETVATVTADADGVATITAISEGFTRITASHQGISASIIVDVAPDENNPNTEKLLDLSGDIRVAGFEKESEALVYNGQKITQNLRVYHKDTLLKEKTDYTLSYKNNINAAAWNAAKAPSVTINLKGQYQGSVTLYFTIKPLDINEIDIYNTPKVSPGYEQTVNYSKKLNIPAPVLTYGKKKLAMKKDFVCDYTTPDHNMEALPADYKNGDLYEAGKVYSYTVNGTGNFTGSFPMRLVVLKDKTMNFNSASVKLDQKQYEYHGTPLTQSDVHVTEVKIGGTVLPETHYRYAVYAAGIEGSYVMLSPTDTGIAAGYHGCKKVTLKLTGDRQLKDAVAGEDWKEEISFSQKIVDKEGGIFQKGASLLTYADTSGAKETLVEGTDYTIKYGNAKKAGKVTVTFTGKGRYKGSLRLSYTIKPNTNIKIYPGINVKDVDGTYQVAYQKNGAVPELILKDSNDTVLKNKTDYTIKYKDNKTPGTDMTCEITGKGNYKGYTKTITFRVTPGDIGQCTLTAADKPYNSKPNKWQTTVTVTDVNGKKLAAGKDYDKNLTYDYKQEQSPAAGTTITVTVTGLGCYEGSSISGTYRIFEKNISTLKVVIKPQEYTGEEIKLRKWIDIHIYASSADMKKDNEIWDDCYDIVESGYKNNIKAGTAKVTLRGKGSYGGTKTYSFKIQKKKYKLNHVKSIQLSPTSLSFPLAETDVKKRTLTATLTAETAEKIANPTVIWSTSNSSVVAIEESPDIKTGITDGKAIVTRTALLILKKEGTATITAVSQDGGKKAQCKVTVVDVPLLKEAGETIKENIGSTHQLHMEFMPSQNPDHVKWESSNSAVVSVAKNEEGALLTMNKAGAAVITATYTSSGNKRYTQQCYAVSVDPEEKAPEGKVYVYEQKPGCTDDTTDINNGLRAWERNPNKYEAFYIPAGVYHINAVGGGFGGIILTDNQKLVMSSSALLVALANSADESQVIWAFGRDNITISGGQIIGEREIHKGSSSGEGGHGIRISGCTNVTIENVDISKCWGDGIYLSRYDGWENGTGKPKTYYTNGVTITNCNSHNNRRSNLTISDASNVTVENCDFNHAGGTSPECGINIEPHKDGYTCRNVKISNSRFKGNGRSIQILGQLNCHVDGVTIENCKGDKAPVIWQGFGGSVKGVREDNNNWNWN